MVTCLISEGANAYNNGYNANLDLVLQTYPLHNTNIAKLNHTITSGKYFNNQNFDEDLDNPGYSNKNYVPCHCCRNKMSDSSNERLFERQIGGSNPYQRKRIHANVSDLNDTVWMDAIEKVKECSRNICESLNACENEKYMTPNDISRDPCSKKSSKSIYADCHSRQFQDFIEESTQLCSQHFTNANAKRPCEHSKMKDVYTAIEDLYGIAREHQSRHECQKCGRFKENESENQRPKSDFCNPNPSKWVPVACNNLLDQVEDLELNDSVAGTSRKESSCSFSVSSEITKQIEDMCDNKSPPKGKHNLNNLQISEYSTNKNSEPSVHKLRRECSCQLNPKNSQTSSQNKENSFLKSDSNVKEQHSSHKNHILSPCNIEVSQEPLSSTCPEAKVQNESLDKKKEYPTKRIDSCLDICIEPSYTKLQEFQITASNESCTKAKENLKSPPIESEVLQTLNRICEILTKCERNMNINKSVVKCGGSLKSKKSSLCKSNDSANLSRSSICNSYPSGPDSEGFTTPKVRISASLLEKEEETEDIIAENKPCNEPEENIHAPNTGRTTERTTSFHSKDCDIFERTPKSNNESFEQAPKSNPESNQVPFTPCGQGCCFPCIPFLPMHMCSDSFKYLPFTCCQKESHNCSSKDENHRFKSGCSSEGKDNGVVCPTLKYPFHLLYINQNNFSNNLSALYLVILMI